MHPRSLVLLIYDLIRRTRTAIVSFLAIRMFHFEADFKAYF